MTQHLRQPKQGKRTPSLHPFSSRLVLWLLFVLWLPLSLACEPAPPIELPPIPPAKSLARPLHKLWQSDGKAWLLTPKSLAELPASAFPLRLSIAAMQAKSPLPHPDKKLPQATHLQINKTDLSAPIALPALSPEGAIVLRSQQGQLLDWTTWYTFPKASALVRFTDKEQFCQITSKAPDDKPCQALHRNIGVKRLRHIRSAEEFEALTKLYGQQGLQTKLVKFVLNKATDDLPHFFNAEEWSLHFTFVWEVLSGQRRLNTCLGEDYKVFWREYQAFNDKHVFNTGKRTYIMGTLIQYPGANLYTIEFATAYGVAPADMVLAYARIRQLFDPRIDIRIRPLTDLQEQAIRAAPGGKEIPLWAPETPYEGEKVQLLSPGVAYGTLKALSSKQLGTATLGLQVIALLKDVPNDINFVGGILSAQFQSPLSHINVLSRNRGTPHLVIKSPLEDKHVAALVGKLVRLEVTTQGYKLTAASRQDAEAYWQTQRGKRKPFAPQSDLVTKDLIDLANVGHKASVTIGAKAANLAEMARVKMMPTDPANAKPACLELGKTHGTVPIPKQPFAIPFYWYADHIERAGLADTILALHADDKLRKDPVYRREELAALQKKIMETTVNPALLTPLKAKIKARYGEVRVRFRSSTNVEDLPEFNGAGLYTSKSGQLGHKTKTIALALQTVWASIWSERAWSERDFYLVDHTKVAMAILVHPSFTDELANGVVVSSNVFYARGSTWDSYIVIQEGENSVVNPEGDITPEQLLVRWSTIPQLLYLSRSSLVKNEEPLIKRDEAIVLGCYMRAVHNHFQAFASRKDKPYAMEAEFKIAPNPRRLVVKQTRPYIFGEDPTKRPTCED